MGKKKVIVGMSGGVDSSVAALLLQRQGYEVAGATFLLQERESPDVDDARRVCADMGIPHHTLNYRERFRREVIDYFAAEYRRGATPNPCVACNRHIKFGSFIPQALEMGFDYVATGHYAIVEHDEAQGIHRLRRATYIPKDQSYVLYSLTREQLAHVLLPLGGYRKEQIRAIAEEAGLAVSRKAESQDICFVPGGDYCAFLEGYTGEVSQPGDFVDANGNVLGRHRGIWHYTVGQRKGLGISFSTPLFVTGVDAASNTVTLAGNDALFSRALTAGSASYLCGGAPNQPLRCTAKIRYASQPAPAELTPLAGGRVRLLFDEPQRAATPGQAVVFYDGEYVIGGATIE